MVTLTAEPISWPMELMRNVIDNMVRWLHLGHVEITQLVSIVGHEFTLELLIFYHAKEILVWLKVQWDIKYELFYATSSNWAKRFITNTIYII